jgi:stage II sporulation protein D
VGVLAAEMPAIYEQDALMAQAVAARSYILSKSNSPNADHPTAVICTDPAHCKGWLSQEEAEGKWKAGERKKYWKKLKSAVRDTCGEYMIYGDEVVEAFFFATSGGKTENSEDVWSTSLPYLRSVESPEDEYGKNYRSSAVFTFDEFYSTIKPYVGNIPKGGTPDISRPKRTQGGSVAEITICGKTLKGSEVRGIFGLKSANFTVTVYDGKVTFDVVGYGHGVGMSQTGANEMAKNGKKYTEILQHYYTNIQIVKM